MFEGAIEQSAFTSKLTFELFGTRLPLQNQFQARACIFEFSPGSSMTESAHLQLCYIYEHIIATK